MWSLPPPQGVDVLFMQSDGGLTPMQRFCGSRAVLSGPAGGVVGYAITSYSQMEKKAVIGFDMGGELRSSHCWQPPSQAHVTWLMCMEKQWCINKVQMFLCLVSGGNFQQELDADACSVKVSSLPSCPSPSLRVHRLHEALLSKLSVCLPPQEHPQM